MALNNCWDWGWELENINRDLDPLTVVCQFKEIVNDLVSCNLYWTCNPIWCNWATEKWREYIEEWQAEVILKMSENSIPEQDEKTDTIVWNITIDWLEQEIYYCLKWSEITKEWWNICLYIWEDIYKLKIKFSYMIWNHVDVDDDTERLKRLDITEIKKLSWKWTWKIFKNKKIKEEIKKQLFLSFNKISSFMKTK